MSKFFVPYSGDTPATLEIKGHRILIVTTTSDDAFESLSATGGDQVREIDIPKSETDALTDLAMSFNGGVVLAPTGVEMSTMIQSLEQELPWVH
jgi:hypothetical protein